MKGQHLLLVLLLLLCFRELPEAQPMAGDSLRPPPRHRLLSFEPAASFDKRRLQLGAGAGIAAYSGISIALWNAWYKNYPTGKFRLFNDWREWNGMDKAGHLFSNYTICQYAFQGARWTGMQRSPAHWAAIVAGVGIMTTIEVMDGFSEQWGFSLGDMAFNTLGAGLFAGQELLWQEQRIRMKVSGIRPDYSLEPLYSADGSETSTIDEHAAGLYGTNFFQVILKDYNALTVWASFNISSFSGNKSGGKFPAWLNLALGYGAGNIYGAYYNSWVGGNGAGFSLDPGLYPRHRQFYLSPDIDWSRIPVRRPWVRFALGALNWIKIPAPALEFNSLGKARWHLLHF